MQENKTTTVGAVIVAAGMSNRMQGIDKQELTLEGVAVVVHSIRAFQNADEISKIVVVTKKEFIEEMKQKVQNYTLSKVISVVCGGETRQISVKNGVKALGEDVDYYVIHDGARPFVNRELISNCLEAAFKWGASTAAIKEKDTVKLGDDLGFVASTLDRNSVYRIQTPQVFEAELYRKAISLAEELDFTDDGQLVEHAGNKVFLVQGDDWNIKITTPQDIPVAQAIAKTIAGNIPTYSQPLMRVGHGYDVHRLVEGRKLIIGGVEIPWHMGLLGHSDADVLTHAVMDALLGAAALGDLGQHFPDTDPEYLGADSLQLLKKVTLLISQKGYTIQNIDCTLIAQRPKLKEHILEMRQKLALICGINKDKISVKATTEEGLGFTGEEKGISAHCLCILSKPSL